ncbi:hypothetical protein [Streptomyces rubradiris]|uniref:Uncharacterized protein n=1 Tax=Streptomyces rubradiris TaxID=285531 RepID=A0ABQ3R3L2_STRRR|nr:hypothetical protein [Streptomyces rubradiris]GHH30309.1 hypothetical protein GCM10018792_76650 [Streptomyces rubradiris]GHI50446.1 hypothetical protein Srubr_02920 [Streptomyces rubradiris]
MSYRPFPNRERATKYAYFHGVHYIRIRVPATAKFPDDGTVEQAVATLPSGTMQFSAQFPVGEYRISTR